MQFAKEQAALEEIAEMILDAATNLYKSTKYIYSLSKENFYSCNIKDVFRVILNNILRADALQALYLTTNNSACAEMNTKEYGKIYSLLVYSFAIRLPALRRVEIRGDRLTDGQIQEIYDFIVSKGVVNYDDIVVGSFAENKARVRKNQPVAPYNSDWYKAFIYTHIPELAEINNRNLFLFGTIDVLFVMFHMRLEEELHKLLGKLCTTPHKD